MDLWISAEALQILIAEAESLYGFCRRLSIVEKKFSAGAEEGWQPPPPSPLTLVVFFLAFGTCDLYGWIDD